MENVKTFLNQIEYYFAKPQFSPQELLILVAIGFICLFVVLWIPLRGIRLWYWKTNKQLECLKSIDERLKNFEVGERNSLKNIVEEVKEEPITEKAAPENLEIKQHEVIFKPGIRRYNVSKSGKVFTLEEIEGLIKN